MRALALLALLLLCSFGECYGSEPRHSTADELRSHAQSADVQALRDIYAKMSGEDSGFYHDEKEFNILGYELLGQGLVEQAIEVFCFNTRRFPGSANVYDSLAEAYFGQEMHELAEQNYKLALQIDPHYRSAWRGLEQVYQQQKKLPELKAVYEQARQSTDLRGWATEKLGDLARADGKDSIALSHYLDVWRATNKPDGALDKAVAIYAYRGDVQAMARLYRLARTQAPELFDLWQQELELLRRLNDVKAVRDILQDAKTQLPKPLYARLDGKAATDLSRGSFVHFTAMGCGPYSDSAEQQLAGFVAQFDPEVNGDFIVHLGDLFSGAKNRASRADFEKLATVFAEVQHPTFVVLGDNEWNDQAKPAEALDHWKATFAKFNRTQSKGYQMRYQQGREENFAFQRGDVAFIGINQVGGRVHDESEWKRRIADNGQWIDEVLTRQLVGAKAAVIFAQASADVFDGALIAKLQEAARKFDRPILYLHADGHEWSVEPGKWASNITRVQSDLLFHHHSEAPVSYPPVSVFVEPSAQQPFVFERRRIVTPSGE